MPRCNLTLKQKCQIIELSNELSTEQIAKKYHVHPTTVTRTLQKKEKIIEQSSRVNINFKTVQTNKRGEEHDTMVLNYIRSRQEQPREPLTIKEICDKAVEFAKDLDREIKSKRGWWRRFKVRCNIIKSKINHKPPAVAQQNNQIENVEKQPIEDVGKEKNRKPSVRSSNSKTTTTTTTSSSSSSSTPNKISTEQEKPTPNLNSGKHNSKQSKFTFKVKEMNTNSKTKIPELTKVK